MVMTAMGLAGTSFAQTGKTAVERFGGCIAAQKSGDVLLMIDESGSLQDTDPAADRVTAARFLAKRLADFASDAGVTISVSIAGFSDAYHPYLGWTKLDASSLPQVQSDLDAFRGRNTGQDTDYWLALEGARKALNDAPKSGERGCQALAWFSDGKLDYNPRTLEDPKPYAPNQDLSNADGVNAMIQAAQADICRERGVADQLRSSDIVTFGIGLTPNPDRASDFDLMRSIVTGQPSGSVTSCGAITDPVPGDFHLAQNIDDLLFAFDEFSAPGQAPIENTSGACAKTICEEAKHRFVLDRSVRSVSVLAAADKPGLIPNLVAPDGTALPLDGAAGVGDLGGVKVDHEPQGKKSVSFKMSGSSAPQWQGVWALVFVDPTGDATAKTRSSIHIAGDLYPAWPDVGKATLRSGDANVVLNLGLVDGQQKPFDAAGLLGQATLSAILVDVEGKERPVALELPKDQIATPQTLNLTDVPPGAATLHLSLDVTTADATEPDGTVVPGTKLAPQSVDLPVVVDPPVGYPKVAESIDFGAHEGAGTFRATLQITGPGCAWLPSDADVALEGAPDGVGNVSLTSSANTAGNCVKPGDGQQDSLPVDLVVQAPGNGAVNGTVKVMVGPADGSAEPIAVQVPFTASLTSLDIFNFYLALAAALILGPGIPALLFYGSKWWVNKIPARGLRVQQIPVRVSGDTVYRDNGLLALRSGELVDLVGGLEKPVRRLTIGDITLETRIGLSPFGTGFVVASAPGRAGAAGPDGATHGKTPDAKLPLAIHNRWFVLIDPNGAPDAATLVLMVAGGVDSTDIDRMITEVSSTLPRFIGDLRARAKPSDAGPTPVPAGAQSSSHDGPFGGGPFGGGPFGGSPPPSGPYGSDGPPVDPNSPFR